MKKIIATAAGLMLAGTMAVTATATETERQQITVKGDARTRLHLQRDFLNGKETNDFVSSRIRVSSKYKAKGGAYARVRLRFTDTVWDTVGNSLTNDSWTTGVDTGSNIIVDRAWIGVPVGPVTIEGGLTPTNVTRFTSFDERKNRLSFTYKNEGTILKASYDKNKEYFESDDITFDDFDDDEDLNTYSLQLNQDLGEEWKIVALAGYQDDETPADAGGFIGSLGAFGKMAGLGAEAEIMFVEEGAAWGDTKATSDDALGGQVSLSGQFGDVSLKGTIGFTDGGLKVDRDYGYLMIGSYSPIVDISNIGNGGDTIFGGFVAGFKVSDKTKLTGNIVYLDIDVEDGVGVKSALEISGQVTYSVSEGASLSAGLGFLEADTDGNTSDPDTSIGAFGSMDITF